MKTRMLGRTGFNVSEIGYGAWGIGGSQWVGAGERTSLAALQKAIELGINFVDTALAYGDGNSERLVGRAVRDADAREIYVATKVPPKNRLWPARPGIGLDDVFPQDYIVASAEQSLKNLGVDAIDLLQLHVWNPEWIGREEWRRAFEDLKSSGKVRAVGISINDHQPDSALEIIGTGLIDTVQVIYNIFDQTPEQKLFPLCREKKIGVIARVPLDEGALTGTITPDTVFPEGDFRNFYFRDDRKKQVAGRVNSLITELEYPADQLPELALRFCISNPAVSTVIPGMRTIENVAKNSTVPGQGPLPAKVLAILKRHAWDRNFYM
ncbi:MAG: aldo/keto reductase [Acidobacteriota bacterium]|nr:aldo/keto reductase [Acidobacteriota bacterium]